VTLVRWTAASPPLYFPMYKNEGRAPAPALSGRGGSGRLLPVGRFSFVNPSWVLVQID
jgi:hypothetical protein